MSERSERLFEALGQIDGQKIDEAAPEGRSRPHWKRWAALAAALALVIGAGSYVLPRLGQGGGAPGANNGGGANNTGAGGGGTGADGGSAFMSYAGPVFPLTLKEADPAVTAQREITMEFGPRSEWIFQWGAQVTDRYTLTNTAAEDRSVSVLYPFVSELQELWRFQPTLTVDGQTAETVLHAGAYAGGFVGAEGPEDGRRLNLSMPGSWEDYRALLAGGSYLAGALGEFVDLSGTPVTVYKFFDAWGPEPSSRAGVPNPTIRASFTLDYDKTTVLSYGFHGMTWDEEAGTMIQSFSIPQPDRLGYGDPCYLIVLGDDIGNLTTGGYVTGGTDADTEALSEYGVEVERYTTDLDSVLRDVTRRMYDNHIKNYAQDNFWNLSDVDYEMYHGLFCGDLLAFGLLSDHPAERYETGWLEELDVVNVDRVFYLEAQVTIPAGGSVSLSADLWKEASYDFYCGQAENEQVHGYDMVTRLGSNLTFTGQAAVLEDGGQVEIAGQNFGFDLEKGVTRVELDPNQEHYYLEVRQLP